ncbi:ligase-associated DNA damage response endonuclease PdeM [Hydrotalea sp.]|uniref:ligase-associated DNA damage response endonuclease PdeM n=1 Tax=Hydrotalea sp. TaxID=2881279 RepID=UPI00260AD5AE|nr:ligase-associated DNA damage response endonuclease PdeM [Hydrotalea sp.]
MQAPYLLQLFNQHLWLSSEKCIFWEEEAALILSDMHIGKTGHFKQNGIPMPEALFKEDMNRLLHCISEFNPKALLIVGDLLHKKNNEEVAHFLKRKSEFTHIPFHLVKGNHDVLPKHWYTDAGIVLHPEWIYKAPFLFLHDITITGTIPEKHSDAYTITGHIHPGVRLKISGKQHIHLPCFYFGKQHAILPAFSNFTGIAVVKPGKKDKVFAIAKHQIIPVT